MRLSLRAKLASWSAAVTALALVTFGLMAAINLRLERAEKQSGREARPEAERTEEGDDPYEELLTAYLLAAPAVVLVVAAGSWWVARKAMRPMEDITRATAAITAQSLGERLPEPANQDEIGAHIRALNQMFDRLQRSFEQANRFTADASHELRTPLTVIRGELEDALRFGSFDGEQEKLIVGVLEEVGGLQRIADNLLLLSRFDAGAALPEHAPVDLSELVLDCAQDAELLAEPQGLTVTRDIPAGIQIKGDRILLRRMLLNLLDNAVRYNRPKGSVDVRLRADGAVAAIHLANTGEGVPADQQGDLFKRFFGRRLNLGRATGGNGLGLSLCREIALAHQGEVSLVASAADQTEFQVRLPIRGGGQD